MPRDSSAPPTDPLIARLPLLDQAISPRHACGDAEGPDAAALSDHNEHTACQISEGGESPSLPTQQSLPRPRTPQTSTKNHSNTAIHPTPTSTSSSSSLSGMLLRDTRAPQGGVAMMSDADLGDNQASRATMATVKDPGHVPPSLQNNMMASGSGLLAKGGVMRRILYPPDGGGLRPVRLPLCHPSICLLVTIVARSQTAMPLRPSSCRGRTSAINYTVFPHSPHHTCIAPLGSHCSRRTCTM
jgi:hypothetical protein